MKEIINRTQKEINEQIEAFMYVVEELNKEETDNKRRKEV
jgi:hypothetical protein